MDHSYALIVDAGSTGSRLYMYHVGEEGSLSGGVSVTRGKKVRPGLASFVRNASEAVEQMQFLLADGIEMVPLEKRAATKAMIRCTGGVRDELEESERQALLEAIGAGLWGLAPFDVDVVSGHDEAFYSFAAANFLENRIDHLLKPTGHLIGALDLGGSSTQITYATTSTSDSESTTIGRSFLFAKSFPGLGAQAVREKLLSIGLEEGHDPCSHVGFSIGDVPGSGDFDACADAIRTLILTRADDCDPSLSSSARRRTCSIGQTPIEKLPPHTTFLAMCNFFYAADAIRALAPKDSPIDDWPTPNLLQLKNAAKVFCALPWNFVATTMKGIHPYTPEHLLPSRCFDAAYILVLLRDVYALDDFPRVTFAIDAKGGAEVEWTLGYYISEILQPSTLDNSK